MRLATRVTAFFLGALAVVLVGFSTALLVSASGYLNRGVSDRLAASLAVLAAATEIQTDGVEWEPHERLLRVGPESGPDRVRWSVHNGEGRRIDGSPMRSDGDLLPSPIPSIAVADGSAVDPLGHRWRLASRWITAEPGRTAMSAASEPSDEPGQSALLLTVATPAGPVDATLAKLAWLLLGLSAAVLGIAAVLGRSLVDHALAPLTKTVAAARGLDASDPGWSLPRAGTGDELDDLVIAFNDLLGRLRLAYERQRRFAADASHQLRTPLTAMIGQVEVAMRRERHAEEYRRVLGVVHGQAGGLARIVEALLFLGRTEDDAGSPDVIDVELGGWAARHVSNHVLAGRIRLDLSMAWARVHSPLLGQMVDNLLDNAEKYGPPGGEIRVRVTTGPGQAILSVEDDGPGIDPSDADRVFRPFFRAERSRRLGRGGVGLGLAVAQRIATAFGGRIEVESLAVGGCRFSLVVPSIAPPSGEATGEGPAGLAVSVPSHESTGVS